MLIGEMRSEGAIDQVDSGRGEADDPSAGIGCLGPALHQTASFEPVLAIVVRRVTANQAAAAAGSVGTPMRTVADVTRVRLVVGRLALDFVNTRSGPPAASQTTTCSAAVPTSSPAASSQGRSPARRRRRRRAVRIPSASPPLHGAGVDGWGVAASLGAMVASSLGFVLTARWGSGIPALPMTAWQLIGGSLVLLPAALLVEGAPPTLTVSSALGFAYVTLIATALAYVAWFAGLRHLAPGVVGVVGLLNPVTGVVLGVALAGEAFGLAQALGIALVLGGIVLGTLPSRTTAASRRAMAVVALPALAGRDGMGS